jgi:hypothetical protein
MKFVRDKYPDKYDEWIGELPAKSRILFINPILATQWYPIQEGMIIPTKLIAKFFYGGNEKKASYAIGEYSAKVGLSSVYRIFVKIASTTYVLSKCERIFKTYYETIDVDFEKLEEKKVRFMIKGFKTEENLIFSRICGWISELLRIIGQEPEDVVYNEIPAEGEYVNAEIIAEWK